MPDHDPVCTIGAAAAACGLSAPTLRYYEEIGLIPAPERSAAGQRRFTARDVARLTFIRRCRAFGFGLDEVRHLLDAQDDGGMACDTFRDAACDRLAHVRARQRDLARLADRLSDLIAACESDCRPSRGTACTAMDDGAVVSPPTEAQETSR